MDAEHLKRLAIRFGPALLAGAMIGALFVALLRSSPVAPAADARQVSDAALVSVREQGRLSSFAARYVAVVTSTETRLGLEARKTLILPGMVRYGIDLRRLRREHMSWDEATRTLSIELPPLEISGPDIDMAEAREYSEGGVLMVLTDAEQALDEANLARARQELLRQARDPVPLNAARDAAMRIVARGFAVPLRAAGIDATVSVRFVDPAGRDEAVHLERARRVEEVVRDRQAGERQPANEAR